MRSITALLCLSASVFSYSSAMAAPNVVVSIKPIHSLVAAVMDGVGEPKLIVEGAASPHTYSLKPSNAKTLQDADVVFWVGHGLEAFLEKPLEALATKATVIELEDAKGLEKLKFREGGAFEAHDHGDEGHGEHAHGDEGHDHAHEESEHKDGEHAHEAEEGHEGHDHAGHDHAGHDHGEYDMHLWLDPMNAKAMAAAIETTLIQADPSNAAKYQENAKKLMENLDKLDTELATTLEPVKDKPFVVFHDAYQYFEHRYKVRVAGSITVSPETMPGADRVRQIHDKIKSLNATCVFAEPQFEPKLVRVVTEGTDAKSGTLDPEAATFKEGPSLYFDLMRGIATSIKDCLS
jgi:zinc transport system substrate-binding protein